MNKDETHFSLKRKFRLFNKIKELLNIPDGTKPNAQTIWPKPVTARPEIPTLSPYHRKLATYKLHTIWPKPVTARPEIPTLSPYQRKLTTYKRP